MSEPVSEINVAQPPLSEGYQTVRGMGHLLGYARVSTIDQLRPGPTATLAASQRSVSLSLVRIPVRVDDLRTRGS